MPARILVVDDDPDVCALLTDHLEALGYAVLVARTGEEALATVRRDPPALVLLDAGLPGMHGLVVLSRLHRSDPRIGVIVVTGRDDDALALLARRLGALEYLRKPIDLAQLGRAVQAALAGRGGQPFDFLGSAAVKVGGLDGS